MQVDPARCNKRLKWCDDWNAQKLARNLQFASISHFLKSVEMGQPRGF
jgi:hypothetical protein